MRNEMTNAMRVFPEVRSAHIDEIDARSPRRTLYFRTYYDLRHRSVPAHWEQVSYLQAIGEIWRAPPSSLELFEPVWLPFLPIWIALAVTYKIRTWRNPGCVGFFAIENNTLSEVIDHTRLLRRVSACGVLREGTLRAIRLVLVMLMRRLVDRVAYGTDAAAELYARFAPTRGPEARVTHDLLAARVKSVPEKQAMTAAFVGALKEYKGVPLLLSAWERVERSLPAARIVILGMGRCVTPSSPGWQSDRRRGSSSVWSNMRRSLRPLVARRCSSRRRRASRLGVPYRRRSLWARPSLRPKRQALPRGLCGMVIGS